MIKIKPADFKLRRPTFTCDSVIHPQIKPCFPNKSFFMLLVGCAGSGKTSFMVSLLNSPHAYKKVFRHILLLVPPTSRKSLKNDPFVGLPNDQIFGEFDIDAVFEKIMSLKENIEPDDPNKHMLVIIDDFASELKNKSARKKLSMLIANRRHMGVSILLLTQYFQSVPKELRQQVSHYCQFRPKNLSDVKRVKDEYLNVESDVADAIYRRCFADEYGFLMLNLNNGKIYCGLDEIILDD